MTGFEFVTRMYEGKKSGNTKLYVNFFDDETKESHYYTMTVDNYDYSILKNDLVMFEIISKRVVELYIHRKAGV